jgi:hypothetical protein
MNKKLKAVLYTISFLFPLILCGIIYLIFKQPHKEISFLILFILAIIGHSVYRFMLMLLK